MSTARQKWEPFARAPQLLEFLDGLFNQVGIRVTDTGEEFTCARQPDHMALIEGIDSNTVDFVVEIDSSQVDRVAAEAATGVFSEAEKYRILINLVGAPLEYSATLMNNRALGSPLVRKLLRVVDVAHIYVQSPTDEEPDETFTLSLEPTGWELARGLHGSAGRIITVDLANALEFHRETFAYKNSSGPLATLRYLGWYLAWRRRVSRRT